MSHAYSCLVVLSMAVAIHGLAAPEITPRAVIAPRSTDCPYLKVDHTDATTSIQGCCVGGSDEGQQPYLSVCEGWPICDGPTTTTWTATPISCAAMIAFTDANYAAELSSAEKAFSANSKSFCYTVGGADDCAGGSAAKATTTSNASSASESGNGQDGSSGGDAAATGGDAAATGSTAVGNAGSTGSAVNSGNGSSNSGVSVSGSSGSSSSSNSGSSGSSSSSSGTTGSGSSSSGGSSSSTTSTNTTTTDTSGANMLGLGWGAWALGLAGAAPVVMAVML